MITFGNISALLAVPLIIFAALFSLFCFNRIQKSLLSLRGEKGKQNKTNLHNRYIARTILWTLSMICLVIAYSEPYFGTKAKAIQTRGNSIALVFDISYSMMAEDMPSLSHSSTASTRLDYMVAYTSQLLSRFANSPVSVVLAKGSGVLAIPSTSNYTVIYPLLQSLSPYLLSSVGSDLGSGVTKAIQSFPSQTANASTIIIFTDGDETKNSLQTAIDEATKYGIEVILIGIGSTNESEIIAGDGKTLVKTALQEKHLSSIAIKNDRATYLNAQEVGSAVRILQIAQNNYTVDSTEQAAYSQEPYPRFMLFLIISICSFLLGVIVMEFQLQVKKISSFGILIVSLFFYSSCSNTMSPSFQILTGVFAWNQKDYSQAVVSFVEAKALSQKQNDLKAEAYSEFALAAAYLAQNETQAAQERIQSIPTNVSDELSFGIWYNYGIIAHREGDYVLASEYFKKALLIKPNSLDAKINLELSRKEKETFPPQQGAQESIPINESQQESATEQKVFSIIREKEQTTWKTQEGQTPSSEGIDY